jgi:hypothetical protein
MDREIKEFLNEQGVDRPVMSIRQVGSRTEIHLMGDDLPLIYQKEPDPATKDPAMVPAYTAAQLQKKKVVELREITEAMGLPAKGLKKAVLIENILKNQVD